MQFLTSLFRVCMVLLLSCVVMSTAKARHIIGGEITYECLGNGDYEITMYIYRDCNSGGGELDQRAAISIFECGVNVNCAGFNQASALYNFQVRLDGRDFIPTPDYPCLIPPNLCVERGFYQFLLSDFGVSLPPSDEDYHIVYQRCCRNETIDNIRNPGAQGATYTTVISPESYAACNNAPVFKDFPPTVVCLNNELNFDHSANDADGDSLVYEFCSPLHGGGQNMNSNGGCNSPVPSPPCPPPFDRISFITPTYSGSAPIQGITIDRVTGKISGKPNLLGQFVVGVCVYELRDNQVIGKTFRDFQFNVTNCDPTVIGLLDAEKDDVNDRFIVKSCGDLEVTLDNISYDQSYIDSYFWEFDVDGSIIRNDNWDATFNFPDIGVYQGNLYLNPNEICGDTVDIVVNIYPEIISGFDFEYDTCIAGPVQFINESYSGSGNITSYEWDFGDMSASDHPNPVHTYADPGDIPVRLKVRDINECEDILIKSINYYPVPSLVVIAPSAETGCNPLEIFFNNLSYPIDDSYEILWDFGDGGNGDEISPTYVYENPGYYDVSVKITSPIGCTTDTFFQDLIYIDPSPIAAFDYSPKNLNRFNRRINLIDQSVGAVKWKWDFGASGASSYQEPEVELVDTGFHQLQLIVTHESGCKDTSMVLVDVKPTTNYFLPNAFTPNYDSKNDEFIGKGILDGIRMFEMTIWNRWGERVFVSNDPLLGWNGRKNNLGKEAPAGVYMVFVNYIGPRGELHEFQTSLTLIR